MNQDKVATQCSLRAVWDDGDVEGMTRTKVTDWQGKGRWVGRKEDKQKERRGTQKNKFTKHHQTAKHIWKNNINTQINIFKKTGPNTKKTFGLKKLDHRYCTFLRPCPRMYTEWPSCSASSLAVQGYEGGWFGRGEGGWSFASTAPLVV